MYTPSGTASGFDYFDITGVQLEKGPVATPFEIRPYATELALCQRYYSNVSIPSSHTIAVATAGNTNCQIVLPIPVPLRSTPAIATTGAFSFRGANADNIITAFTINSTSQNLVNMTGALTTTAGNGVVGGVMALNTNVTIALSSEL
jgi:ABC-type glycerol-3-phosphate transport system permease component